MSAGNMVALSKNDFLSQLGREKKRAERSKAPLSIAIFQGAVRTSFSGEHILPLLQLLASTKRDVDVLGTIDSNTVAVLLVDTPKKGSDLFLQRIGARLNGTRWSVTSGTYPDDIFEEFASGTPSLVEFPRNWSADHEADKHPQRALKRIIDILGASLALILFSPVMLVTAVAVGLTSPGPIIFKQVRMGKGGNAFTFYKFRSMFCNADDRLHRDYVTSLIRKGGQSVDDKGEKKSTWTKLPHDPRVTPVGKIIRNTKLDELPQLFNVLKGDLSLVGPRPPLPYEVENYEAWHFSRILRAKPGITGIWQIEGRDDTTFDDMVRMDLRYVRTWSVLLDLKILMKTALTVFRLGRRELTAREPTHGETGKSVRTEA